MGPARVVLVAQSSQSPCTSPRSLPTSCATPRHPIPGLPLPRAYPPAASCYSPPSRAAAMPVARVAVLAAADAALADGARRLLLEPRVHAVLRSAHQATGHQGEHQHRRSPRASVSVEQGATHLVERVRTRQPPQHVAFGPLVQAHSAPPRPRRAHVRRPRRRSCDPHHAAPMALLARSSGSAALCLCRRGVGAPVGRRRRGHALHGRRRLCRRPTGVLLLLLLLLAGRRRAPTHHLHARRRTTICTSRTPQGATQTPRHSCCSLPTATQATPLPAWAARPPPAARRPCGSPPSRPAGTAPRSRRA